MGILESLIELMNKEEIRHFKLFINRTNPNPERKDITLFDHIRKSNANYDEEKIWKKNLSGAG